jgi:hypothetical protein
MAGIEASRMRAHGILMNAGTGQESPSPWRAATRAFGVALVLVAMPGIAAAEDAQITRHRAAERKSFTDAEITQGFLKTAFGAELRVAGASDRIRKFDRPVRVYVDSGGRPDRSKQVAGAVTDIGARVRHLDIATINEREGSNVLVTLVRQRALAPTIRRMFGPERARQIARRLAPQCLSGFQKDESFRIVHSDVIVAVDGSDFQFYDCLYEELLQSLGPINDTKTVPWTMFNDDVHMGFFDVYDQYILNILYDPRMRPGMTAAEAKAVLPQVLPDVRAFVAKVNGLAK